MILSLLNHHFLLLFLFTTQSNTHTQTTNQPTYLPTTDKYHDDEETVSDDDLSYMSHDSHDLVGTGAGAGAFNSFQRLDLNRMRRRASLMRPEQMDPSLLQILHKQELIPHSTTIGITTGTSVVAMMIPEETTINTTSMDTDWDTASVRTEKRSNTTSRQDLSKSLRKSLRMVKPMPLRRSQSTVDEVEQCLLRSRQNYQVDLIRDYHRDEAGQLRERKFKDTTNNHDNDDKDKNPFPARTMIHATAGLSNKQMRHKSTLIGTISPPIQLTPQTLSNLGKVHYQLAVRLFID